MSICKLRLQKHTKEFGNTLKEGTVINHSNRKYILDSIEYSKLKAMYYVLIECKRDMHQMERKNIYHCYQYRISKYITNVIEKVGKRLIHV